MNNIGTKSIAGNKLTIIATVFFTFLIASLFFI